MKIEQIYTGCIAQAAYYLESNGEAAIFDPLREVQPYIDKANAGQAQIKYIFETHFHADFVSGHLDLARKTGAQIVYGPTAAPKFDAVIATDNQEFKIGDCTVKAIHTPGHTMESTCYLIIDEHDVPQGIITGDTLFIGDVGRPDLAQEMATELTQEKLASELYDSLRNKIMVLPDALTVYPSHGAGSACGKNMSKETTDTLGNQKKTNYALRADMSREEFIAELLDGLGAPPAYFPQNVAMNIEGYESLDAIIGKSMTALTPKQFKALAGDTDAIILDVRHENDFVKSHIPGSIFIGIDGNFAPWVGALVMNVSQPLLIVTPPGREQETITRLSRVGFDHVLGYLEGGLHAWAAAGMETDAMESIGPEDFASGVSPESIVVDARKPGEFSAEHVPGAINIALDSVNNELGSIPQQPFYLHCAGGYRSVIMGSILKSRGIHHFTNVEQGISGIRKTGVRLSNFVCPSESKQ
ncbi:MBL fold metallo-hydrolase [Flavobacterium magnum]|uniref:MBL fold metallo-hydrolase n=1 Tax=Flavobacterium magnum TaxID=2162713 RepID=A0A2S0RG24_9FLAO|nr:MBL fold metallo-hydrolase [Flavobacterium magnum]AWA30877.1 MBL fold metallo-hydrolase [Flavobacterium magnum]